jgi:hypothetical protein
MRGVVLAAAGVVLLCLLGCSGTISFNGDEGTNIIAAQPIFGDAEFRYRWSAANDPTATPPAAFSVELFDDGVSLGIQRVARDGTDLALVRFRDLRVEHLLFVARTFAADGRQLMEGWGGVSLRHGSTLVIVTQDALPILMDILPADPLVAPGRQVRLAAMLRTEQGSVVLVPPGAVTWSSEDNALRVDAPGLITAFRTGRVIARLAGSVLEASTEACVSGIPGALGRIVFVLDHDGFELLEPDGDFNHDIWGMFANGNALRRLTRGHVREIEPCLSRDGRWVAFAADRDGAGIFDIVVVPFDGGPARLVALNARRPQFLTDGRLAFTRLDGLYTCALDGGSLRRLFANPLGQFFEFRVCPDGSLLYLSVQDDPFGGRDLFHGFATGFAKRLTFFNLNDGVPSSFMMHSPILAPCCQMAAFAWGRTGLSSDLFLINLDGSAQRLLLHTDDGSIEHLVFSPDGVQILFDTGQNRAREFRQLWLRNADGSLRLVCANAFWADWVE